jgi:hypothetical protein
MSKEISFGVVFLFALVWVAGCGKDARTPNGSGTKTLEGAKYLLSSEPAKAKGVIEARAQVKDGDTVVVLGRVGGSKEPSVTGRVAFTIVDRSLIPCNEIEGDTCPTPWDYCCVPKDELARGTVMVKIVDAKGKTLPHDVKDFCGIQPLQTVVVQGKAKRDGDGNLTVLAEGIYIRP